MKQSSIELKSTKYVLTLVMDPDVPFSVILSDVTDTFRKSARFFAGASMAMGFSGRELTQEEQRQVLSAIRQACEINITCIIEENEDRERAQYEAIARALPPDERKDTAEEGAEIIPGGLENTDLQEEEFAEVLRATLKNGQRVYSDRSILVLGDVEPGAEVASGRNVFVAGCAMGTLRAGVSGCGGCYAAALIMKPATLEVDGHRSVSAIRKKRFDDSYTPYPQVCTIEDGHMKMDTISGRTWMHIFERLRQTEEEAQDS